jgi:arylsulfatase A-like enzyme
MDGLRHASTDLSCRSNRQCINARLSRLRAHAIFAIMTAPDILVVVVDGLRASALGAYGNTTYPTAALDRFAAESILFDWCFALCTDLPGIYRACWHAEHPARSLQASIPLSLPKLLASIGYSTALITDEPVLTSIAAADGFHQCIQLQIPPTFPKQQPGDNSESSIAKFFADTCDFIASAKPTSRSDSPRLLWAHSRGMYGPWDAPIELQDSLLDDGDPQPVESTQPPDLMLSPSDDPDSAFRYACAYAAQMMVLDESWDGIMQTIESNGDAAGWIVVLIGARGFPLGEHRRIGGVDEKIHAEQLHVPYLVRFPNGFGRLARSGQLAAPIDLLPTLLAATGERVAPRYGHGDGLNSIPRALAARAPWRDALVATGTSGAQAIRTLDWCLRKDVASKVDAELYVRPDDRWEANDVAKLCPEVVESLSRRLDEAIGHLSRAQPAPQPRD